MLDFLKCPHVEFGEYGVCVAFYFHSVFSHKMTAVRYIDGGHYMKGFFDQVFQHVTNPKHLTFNVYSVFDSDHKKTSGILILVCGEPANLKNHTRAHMIIDCKNMPNMRPNVPFVYLPFYVTSFGERFHNTVSDLLKPKIPAQVVPHKTKFCAFLYSQQISFRNQLYDAVNRYKAVDALGKARSNLARSQVDRDVYEPGVRTYNDLAVAKYKPYKFVICCENSRHPGYVTEKIVSAMLANAIPIYLGAPDIVAHFNPKSFIHVGNYQTYEDAVEEIQRIDHDNTAYEQMLREPWLVNNELTPYFDPKRIADAINRVSSRFATNPNPALGHVVRRVPTKQKGASTMKRRTLRRRKLR